jgi:hypothetical protein
MTTTPDALTIAINKIAQKAARAKFTFESERLEKLREGTTRPADSGAYRRGKSRYAGLLDALAEMIEIRGQDKDSYLAAAILIEANAIDPDLSKELAEAEASAKRRRSLSREWDRKFGLGRKSKA